MGKFRNVVVFFGIGALLLAGLCSCDSGSDDASPVQQPLSYEYITNNRGFIGGSLIWNPTGVGSQLSAGTKVGVRLGKLEKTQVSVTDLSNLSTEPAVDDTNYWADKSTAENMGVAEAKPTAALFGGTLKDEEFYTDLPKKAVFGYLSVESVTENYILLTFTKVNPDNTRASSVVMIPSGESKDLDGDGISDLKYGKPVITRTGYAKARWLTFICSEENRSTAMFYTFTSAAARAGYRATTADAERIEPGLYAVNTTNDFIFIQYGTGKPASLEGMAYGDYVVSLPDVGPKIEIKEYDIADDIGGAEGGPSVEPRTDTQVKFYNFSYAVTNPGEGNTPVAKNSDEYVPDEFLYGYYDWQFPDPEHGPSLLLEEICEKETVKKAVVLANGGSLDMNGTADQILVYLNTALSSVDVFNAVLEEFIPGQADKKSVSDKYFGSDPTGRVTCMRQIFDEVYLESPMADIGAPDVENIYPWMFVCAGSPVEYDDSVNTAPSGFYDNNLDGARAAHSTFASYDAARKKIRNEWDKFFGVNLSSVLLRPKNDAEKISERWLNGKDIAIILAAGIKGNVNDTSGHTDFTLGAAFYIDIDLNIASIEKGLGDPQATDAIKKYLKYLLGGREIGIADQQIPGCPVPIVYGIAVQFGFTLDLGNINPRLCYIGLYGGEGTVNLDYGVRRKWCVFYPYLNAWATGKAHYPTEFYVGFTGDSSAAYDMKVGPYIKIVPSIGIGCKAVSARASLPTTVGLLATLGINQANLFKEIAMTINVGFNPYAEAKVWKFKLRKDFTNMPLLNHKVRFYPTPVQWMPQ